jgi:hypothetical protein
MSSIAKPYRARPANFKQATTPRKAHCRTAYFLWHVPHSSEQNNPGRASWWILSAKKINTGSDSVATIPPPISFFIFKKYMFLPI